MMKRSIHSIGLLMVLMAFMLFSCDEKEEEVDPLVSTYVFTSATFNETVTIIVQQVEVEFSAGSDASPFVGPGILGAAPCDDTQNAAIELKENGTTFYTCLGEANEAQMGTWQINSARTTLTLNISNPKFFSLNITGLDVKTNSFSGTVENFPLPVDAGVELGAQLPGGLINYQIGSVDVTFTKVP